MLFAGDITHVGPVGRAATSMLPREKPVSLETVSAAMLSAYRAEYETKINAHLAHLNLDHNAFIERGREKLGPTLFEQYCTLLKELSLGCQFLIAGFEGPMGPRIFEVSRPIEKYCYDPIHFWAIGTGAQSALDMLAFHGFTWRTPIEQGIYHICETKFMSERALGVGKKTSVLVMRIEDAEDDKWKVEVRELSDELLSEVRQKWQRSGAPRIPRGASELIKASLGNQHRMRRMGF